MIKKGVKRSSGSLTKKKHKATNLDQELVRYQKEYEDVLLAIEAMKTSQLTRNARDVRARQRVYKMVTN